MTAPTPEGIIMWHAAIEAAAGLFHDEQMTIWSSEIMADMALDAGVQPADYDGVVDCYRAIRETLTEIGNAIRALPTPVDLRAALAAMVKPLVWEEKDGRSYRQANTQFGQYQVSWLVEFECWQLSRPHKPGTEWRSWFSRHPNKDEAKVAAEADYCRRVVAAIMGDEG